MVDKKVDNMKQNVFALINNNLKTCLLILILAAVLDISAFVVALGYSSILCISSLLAYMFAIYAISNVIGAKFGRLFNTHIIRWHYLRKHNKARTYQAGCLKYIAVMLPVSAIWSIVNIFAAIVSRNI